MIFPVRSLDLARRLLAACERAELRLATAESCTGGWIAKCCTDRAGSSEWFDRGYVVYSYRAKEQMLGVDHDDLVEHGAVSEEIAHQMAEGAKEDSHVAVTVSACAASPDSSAPARSGVAIHAIQGAGHRSPLERFAGRSFAPSGYTLPASSSRKGGKWAHDRRNGSTRPLKVVQAVFA